MLTSSVVDGRMSYDCFLSYASTDLAAAEIIHRNLATAGFRVWFDKVRLQPGFNWHREIKGGCERVLIEIHEKLFTRPTTALTQRTIRAVTALGGVGKTTVARHYAEQYWRCYQQMFWVDCPAGIESSFALIHDMLRPEPAFS